MRELDETGLFFKNILHFFFLNINLIYTCRSMAAPMTRPRLWATKLVMTLIVKNMKNRIGSQGWSDIK